MSHPSEARFIVLHALRIKGFATTDLVVDLTGYDVADVTGHLQALRSEELATYREARDLWQLTPKGREVHASELDADAPPLRDGLAAAYPGFLELNTELKELCGAWQLRPGPEGDPVPNDHADPDYDGEVVTRLSGLDEQVQPLCGQFGQVAERYQPYGARLAGAAEKVRAGDPKMFTGVMCGSYHDIWMELHEDLILTMGINRSHEGSF